MKLYTAAVMRGADRYAIETLGVPSIRLMDRAARCVAEAAAARMDFTRTAAVFCGPGNNGGDGVGAAVHLLEMGAHVRVFLVGSREKMTPDTREMARRLERAGALLETFSPACDEMVQYANGCGVIVDALFGTGLNTDIRGDAAEAVRLMNGSPAPVVSADIPSGVEADTGRVLGTAVRADATVTFTGAKPGHFSEPGCLYCGEISVHGIGVPQEAADAAGGADTFAVMEWDARLPRRRPDAHKGDFGRCLIVAGSVGYTGAPAFAANACVRTGAGLVCLGVPREIYPIEAVKCSEAMPFPLPDENGLLARAAAPEVLGRLAGMDACLIGPGLGRSPGADETVYAALRTCRCPLILDADGINAVSRNIDSLDEAKCPVILTPHPGEFARLAPELSGRDRLSAARAFAAAHSCVVVLKGHRTVTAFPDGEAYINTTGGPGMARGGSGDVLSGMLTALAGQGLPLKHAVPAAVYLHGKAGDLCAEKYGEYAMTPTDMTEHLAEVLKNSAR